MRLAALAVAGLLPFTAAVAAQSCNQEAGADKAGLLVAQCVKVSTATRAPCNAQNPCDVITAAIYRGCHLMKDAARPAFCGPEPNAKPNSPPEIVPKG